MNNSASQDRLSRYLLTPLTTVLTTVTGLRLSTSSVLLRLSTSPLHLLLTTNPIFPLTTQPKTSLLPVKTILVQFLLQDSNGRSFPEPCSGPDNLVVIFP